MQQFYSASSLSGVPHQHLVQESLQLWRNLLVLELGRRHVTDPSHGLQRRFIEKRRFSINHFNYHDSQGPNVDFRPIRKSGDDFWTHPVGRPHQRLSLRQLMRDLGAEPEVGQLDIAVSSQQDGVRLDVSMNDALRVKVGQGLETLFADGGNLVLRHANVGHDVSQCSTFQVFHDYPEFVVH